MEYIIDLLYGTAPQVHYLSFGLLMLSGLNFPISEDLVFIISASIAATIIPENTALIFGGCFLGAFVSDSVVYCIGRFGGRKLLEVRFFAKIFHEKKMLTIENYFVQYGGKTLFFGRFIPFGVRNVMFMTSGFIRMKYRKFFFIDLMAVTFTSSILFFIGYTFGKNYRKIFPVLDKYKLVIFSVFILLIIFILIRKKTQSKKEAPL